MHTRRSGVTLRPRTITNRYWRVIELGSPPGRRPGDAAGVQMHANQLSVPAELVRALVDEQFPQWRRLPVRMLAVSGSVNAIFRIGERLAARFPLQPQKAEVAQRRLEAEADGCLPDPVLAGLIPAMLADQVGGDPIQPGPCIGLAEVVPVPLSERGQERLGDQVIGGLAVSTPGQVAVNVRGVPVKQHHEPLVSDPVI